MKQEYKDRWVAALRSGEYKQGQHALREVRGDEEKFCCLGVLCALVAEEAGLEPVPGGVGYYTGKMINDESDEPIIESGTLPDAVRELVGLGSDNPDVCLAGEPTTLSRINDGVRIADSLARRVEPFTFLQIADLIEEQL